MFTPLLLALAAPLALAADPSSFSCAISTQTLRAGEPASTVCDLQGTGSGWVSLQWVTGTFGKLGDGLDNVLISLYLDGEALPSLSYFPYEMTGIPSVQAWNSTPRGSTWSSALFARYSATSFTNTMPIPFASGLKVTLQYLGATQVTIYYQAHGLLSAATRPQFGGLPLPAGARMVMQRSVLTLPRLAYLAVSNFSAGTSGLVAAIAIAFTAPNLNTLEGCFHFYTTAATPYPGQLHSTGTEDEFISSCQLMGRPAPLRPQPLHTLAHPRTPLPPFHTHTPHHCRLLCALPCRRCAPSRPLAGANAPFLFTHSISRARRTWACTRARAAAFSTRRRAQTEAQSQCTGRTRTTQ
jgi:hypothetical protein